jgi:aminopeptidase N
VHRSRWNLWTAGNRRQMSEPAFWLAVTIAALPLLLFTGPARATGTELPKHRLAISFDIDEQLLHAVSQIDLPAGTGTRIYLGDFHLGSLSIDGEQLSEAISAGQALDVYAQERARQITVEYHQHYEQAAGALISSEGIALLGHWHPVLDQDAIFELTATVPDHFEAVSEADEIIRLESPAGKRLLFNFPQPVRGISFVAGPYVVEKVAFGKDKELYTYFFPEDQELAASYRTRTLDYLARYEREIGPFPYQRFSVVENRLPTGFAMPTFTLLGQMVVRLPFIIDTSLGHEVLHQWFGNSVRIDASQGNWAEGLTTYLADHAFAVDAGDGVDFRKNQLIRYESYIHAENSAPLTDFIGVGGQEVREEDLRAIGYHKASMVFHMLRNLIGEQAFTAALQDFYERLKFRPASWQDLADSFGQAAGEDLTGFFDQWLTRSDIPILRVEKLRTETEDGGTVLVFELIQAGEQPYALSVPVVIETIRGAISQEITTSQARVEVRIPLPSMPEKLILDPDYDLMRQLRRAELPPVWSRFQGAAVKIAVLPAADADLFQPLLAALRTGLEVKTPEEVTDEDLAAGSVIFMGTDMEQVRALFASPAHPDSGFTVDIRNHPFNPEAVMVLVSSSGIEETARAAGRLRHYGRYSYLHFEGGRIQTRSVAVTDQGQQYTILEPPRGMALPQTLTFEEIVDRLLENRVIYVGEIHTSYEDHLLQLRVIQSLHHRDPNLAIGMEMFSRPAQEVLDAYISGEYSEWEFLKKSKYFDRWGFDYRLYREILDFARNNAIPVIALNLEKEIVSKLYQEGAVSALSEEERAKLPPERDLDLAGYRERLATVFAMHGQAGQGMAPEKFRGFIQAQALWDETMAATVAEYLQANPLLRMVVIAGRGHVPKESGIPPRVARRLDVRQAVVVNGDGQPLEPGSYDYLLFSPKISLPPPPAMGIMLEEGEGRVVIKDFSPHGKAKSSGLKQGDVIMAIDDEPVRSVEDLKIIMLYKKSGKPVRLRVLRPKKFMPDQRLTIEVPL